MTSPALSDRTRRILAALIREHPRFRTTAIIFVSGVHLSDLDRIRGYELGAMDYVPVPVIPEILCAKVKAFVDTYSRSLQQTLYAMGERLLSACPRVAEVRLSLPNRHHFLVDLGSFGLENPGEVFHVDDRPYGLIEGTVLADDAVLDDEAW